MKSQIHPKWYPDAKVTCACGNVFSVGATYPELSVEICSNCHPFYTGQMKFVDRAGRVDKFKEARAMASRKLVSKTEKRRAKKLKKLEEEFEKPESLEELRTKN